MSTAVLSKYLVDAREVDHGQDHAHDSGSNTVFGFWLYPMTDCMLFTSVFTTYAVLVHHTAGGPGGKGTFELPYVLVEIAILPVSSYTYGLVMLSTYRGAKGQTIVWPGVTFLFGVASIGTKINELHHLIAKGFGPSRNAFLSLFLALVGMHDLHISVDLLWMLMLMAQIWTRGLIAQNNTRMMYLSLFWHFLDIVWICVFAVVYLMGAL